MRATLAPALLRWALLIGLASAGNAILLRLVVGDLFGRLAWLTVKPLSCDGCMSAYPCAAAGLVLWRSMGGGPWAGAGAALVAGAALAVSVLTLKLKTRLEA